MLRLEAVNLTKGAVLAWRVVEADTPWKRLKGLLGRSCLEPGEGLLLSPCSAIHSCFMGFKFDALFLGRGGIVLHIIREMPPFRFSPVVRGAVSVLELPAGTVRATGTEVGDVVSISAASWHR